MDESPNPQGDLSEEFKKLGSNLKDALETAWGSPERERLQHEIRTGLRQAMDALAGLAEEAAESEAGVKLRGEIESLGDRVKSGELEAKIRRDLLAALRSLNAELERVWAGRGGESMSESEPEG